MSDNKTVEVRVFSYLKAIFDERGRPFPMQVPLDSRCTAAELAARLELPRETIETVFINGIAGPLERTINPGDRVAFVPPGTPGPYRVILGLINKGDNKKS